MSTLRKPSSDINNLGVPDGVAEPDESCGLRRGRETESRWPLPATGFDRRAAGRRATAHGHRQNPVFKTRWVRETRNAENNWTRASTQRKTVHVYDKSAPQNFGCTGRGESVLAINLLDIRQRVLVADPLCCTGLMFVEIPRHLPTK